VLFCSRSGNAESFQDWATETLFTVQLGTEDSKYELVKSMFGGASIHAIKEAFKTSSGKTPCVYLFIIGNANELLKTDIYSKDTMLYKFGKTDDLPRRSGEHERDFKKMFKINHIELMLFSVIDPKYITDAENSLKQFFRSNIINYENKEELIVLDKIMYTSTIQHYKLIKNSYIGCYMEMQDKIDKLERRLKDLLFSLLRACASKDKMSMTCQKKN
jgi:predicted GIY-YIG superfamily endonuclease